MEELCRELFGNTIAFRTLTLQAGSTQCRAEKMIRGVRVDITVNESGRRENYALRIHNNGEIEFSPEGKGFFSLKKVEALMGSEGFEVLCDFLEGHLNSLICKAKDVWPFLEGEAVQEETRARCDSALE